MNWQKSHQVGLETDSFEGLPNYSKVPCPGSTHPGFRFCWCGQSNCNCAFHFKRRKPWLNGALLFWQRRQCWSTFCKPVLFQLRKKLSGKHSLKLRGEKSPIEASENWDWSLDWFFCCCCFFVLFCFVKPMVNCWTSLLLNIKKSTPNLWI